MILNNDQLRRRAHEFALTQELSSTGKVTIRFWRSFKKDIAFLHEFAKQLQIGNVDCKQPSEDWH